MEKIIPVERLSIGMHVVALDRSWLETNFLFHRFRVNSQDDIEKLRENGIRKVTIELPDASPEHGISDEGRQSGEPDPGKKMEAPPMREIGLPPSSKIQDWMALQNKTVNIVKKSFDDVRMGETFHVDPLRQQVVETIECTLKDPQSTLYLLALSENDDETYVHSINTMVLTLGLAAMFEIAPEEKVRWGLAALLHDIGKAFIPHEILKKPGHFSELEWLTIKKHPSLGYSLLSRNKDETVRGLCATVALEHHERGGGTGYPSGLDLPDLNALSRLFMAVDIYEALTAGRVYRTPASPAKTLSYLLETARGGQIDPGSVSRLIHLVGVYPVGSFVELMDQRIGMITSYENPDRHDGKVGLLILFESLNHPVPEPSLEVLPSIDRTTVRKTYFHQDVGLSHAQVSDYLLHYNSGKDQRAAKFGLEKIKMAEQHF